MLTFRQNATHDAAMNSKTRSLEPQDIRDARAVIARALSVSHLSLSLGAEVVEVVERMHGTISRAPLPWQQLKNDATRGLSRVIYGLIHDSFNGMSHALAQASLALDPDATPQGQWLQARAAINGVCGDRLARQNSPLAIPMQLLQETDADTAGIEFKQAVIFIHGLCMSELGWQTNANKTLRDELRSSARVAIYDLRYNTGLHISDNGRALSFLLESQFKRGEKLHLVGHSMGGLVIRSAQLCARELGHQWPQHLLSAACLGSPHHGAPLERIGNHANRLLTTTPYLKPLSRLGAIRSAGIQDLRHGIIQEANWRERRTDDDPRDTRSLVPLPEGPNYLFVAAKLGPEPHCPSQNSGHDYLVPVSSALGRCKQGLHQLDDENLQREVFTALHHMDLLSADAVHRRLGEFLGAALY